MKKTVFIGIDIASEQFVATIINRKNNFFTKEFSNNQDGFEDFKVWLKEKRVKQDKAIIVMETTGVYCEHLSYFLYSNNYDLCIENALKVKRAFGISPKKTDAIDSKRIAEYAKRFYDQLSLWQPPSEKLEQVKSLLSLRENFVNQKTANTNILKALQTKNINNKLAIDLLLNIIKDLKEKIKNIEKEIKQLITSEEKLGTMYIQLVSIPGVSLLLSSELLVLTDGFTKTNDSKKIASYLGICPNEKSSGKTIKSPSSAGYGHSRIRKLLYLASCSLRYYNIEFKKYFERKSREGKSSKLILNNIANKLVKIICGVINSGKKYIPGFISLPPVLAA